MRHRKLRWKLGRNTSNRKALLRSLAAHLIARQRITTTLAKAKALRPFAERLITLGKKRTVAAKISAIRALGSKSLINRLFDEIAPLFANRHGGYTRIIRTGNRKGDNAEVVIIELTEKLEAEKKAPRKEKERTKKKEPGAAARPESADHHAAPPAERKEAAKEIESREAEKAKSEREKLQQGFLKGLKRYFRRDRG